MVVKGFGSLPYTIRHHQESPFLFIYLINFIFFLTQFAPRGILSSLGIAAQKSFSGLEWVGAAGQTPLCGTLSARGTRCRQTVRRVHVPRSAPSGEGLVPCLGAHGR